MKSLLLRTYKDLLDLLYPVSCLVCGDRLDDASHLCSYCMENAFVPTNEEGRESSEGLVLPDGITMQVSLWEFDKGGFLQDVLHHVKYGGLADLGIALGKQLGRKLMKNRFLDITEKTVLLPAPLHPSRLRKRGYNQSALLASGISRVTGLKLAPERALRRIKNTRTQTGLKASSRRKNLSGAFELTDPEPFRDNNVIVVDDVITTGATVFELADTVRSNCRHIGVATIARA